MLTNLRRLPEVGEQITNCVLAVTDGMHHQYCPCGCHGALHINTISRPHMGQLIIGSISQDEVVELKEAVAAMADALEAFIAKPNPPVITRREDKIRDPKDWTLEEWTWALKDQ